MHRGASFPQTCEELTALGASYGVIIAGCEGELRRPEERVQVASVDTLRSRALRGRILDTPHPPQG